MLSELGIKPKFVVDENGNCLGVYLDLADFELLLDQFEAKHVIQTAEKIIDANAQTFSFEEIKKKYLN